MNKMNRILCFVATIIIGTVDSQYRPINIYSCDDGTPLEAYIDNMIDTVGCKLPQCAGATAGGTFNLRVTYPAKINAQSANHQLYITGVAITTSANDPFAQFLQLPLSVPTFIIVSSNNDLCQQEPNFCPQYAGRNYTFSQIYTIPNEVTTSASLVAEFRAVVTSGSNTVSCFRGFARLMTPLVAALAKLLPPPLSVIG